MDMLTSASRDIRPAPDSGTTRWGLDTLLALSQDRTALLDPPYDMPVAGLVKPAPVNGQNCTVLRTDVVGFSSPLRTSEDRLVIRDAIFRITNSAFQGIVDARSEDRGDGMLTVAGPSIPTAAVIDRLFNWMLPDLEKHNNSHDDSTCFQLRAAIDVGPVTGDSMGFSGDAIINISRLVEAPPFKKALVASGASLGIIATDFIYEAVLKHDRNLTGCWHVRVNVKGCRRMAWMRVCCPVAISPGARRWPWPSEWCRAGRAGARRSRSR